MHPSPWFILEIEKSSFFTVASLHRYLEALSRQLGPWIPRERWIILAPEEEKSLLPVLPQFSSQIFLRSRGWGNAVALFCIFLELESLERDAQVIYFPASPRQPVDQMATVLRKGGFASYENPNSVLLLGYVGSIPQGGRADWILVQEAWEGSPEVLQLSHSQEEVFARELLRQGARRDSGIWIGNVGMALLFYMFSQVEMIAPFLRQRRSGEGRVFAELPATSIPKDFRRDVLRENLPLLRCFMVPELNRKEREESPLAWAEGISLRRAGRPLASEGDFLIH